MSSVHIGQQRAEVEQASAAHELIDEVSRRYLDWPDKELPPLELANVIGSHDLEHFRKNGIYYFEEIAKRLRIRPDAAVLDIGCGCGRMAAPFLRYLEQGHFYGFDAWREGVAWCEANLASPRAEFHHLDLANNYYFDSLNQAVQNDLSLPWLADKSIDHAYAISVFTHLTRRDAQQLLNETARALRPEGLAYLTFFLIDRHVWQFIERTGNHSGIKQVEPGCFYAYRGQDFFGGFTMGVLQAMFAEAGLRVISYELGTWADKPGSRNYQDTFILQKY